MLNIKNNFTVIGRLMSDIKTFDNADGSKKIRFTVAVKDNFRSGVDKTIGTQRIPVEAFLSAENVKNNGLGRYANIHEGDLVGVAGQIVNNDYEKDGVKHYDLVLRIETLEMLEPKTITDARLARKAADAANAANEPEA